MVKVRSGIIDIGYNAVRAVVYDDDTLGVPEVFNSKFKSDIISLLSLDDIKVKHQTYLYLQYVMRIFSNLRVTKIKCMATAVLRDHPRAQDFVDYIKEQFNLEIEVISGVKEAQLTAMGLICGIPNAYGLAADLGGGSLELVEVGNGQIGKLKSLGLGTKVISHKRLKTVESIKEIVLNEYGSSNYETLYLIGGALRFIARFYMEFCDYPMRNLHNLSIHTEEFRSYLQSLQNNNYAGNKQNKRKINHNAVLVAIALLDVFNPKQVVVSNFGLKEGGRYTLISEENRRKNIVIEKVITACNYDAKKTKFSEYHKVLLPLIPETEINYKEITEIAIILNSINKYFDQTLPPKAIIEYILCSEIPFTSKMRLMLVSVVSAFSNFKLDNNITRISKRVLSRQEHHLSTIIGCFLRICQEIDGPEFIEPSFTINVKNGYLEANCSDILPRHIFEKVYERLKSIAFARRVMMMQ